jgi:hypothetical protein
VTLLVKNANTTTLPLSTGLDSSGNLVPMHAPASIISGVATPVSIAAPLPVINTAGSAAIDGSGTISSRRHRADLIRRRDASRRLACGEQFIDDPLCLRCRHCNLGRRIYPDCSRCGLCNALGIQAGRTSQPLWGDHRSSVRGASLVVADGHVCFWRERVITDPRKSDNDF